MWFYKGKKVKYLVDHTKNRCGNNLQNKSYANNHNYCRKHWKCVRLSIQHNRKYPIQNCEKFSPIVGKIGTFLKHHSYCCINSVNCSCAKASKRQQLIAHTSIVKGSTTKCYKHMSFSQTHTLMFLGTINTIGSTSQNKYQSKTLNKNVIATKTHNINGSFFSHKK